MVNSQEQIHPDEANMIAGDFNKAFLRYVVRNFTQYVECAITGTNTLDRVYSNLKHAYRAVPLSHLALSVFLIPVINSSQVKSKDIQNLARGCSLSYVGLLWKHWLSKHIQTAGPQGFYWLHPIPHQVLCRQGCGRQKHLDLPKLETLDDQYRPGTPETPQHSLQVEGPG